jgi:hypothetical protein
MRREEHMNSPQTQPDAKAGHSLAWWLGQAALYFLLWTSLVKFPDAPSEGLDASWKMVINVASDQHLQFGRDIAFTYGPMGYLLAPIFTGRLYETIVVWQIVGNLFIAAGLWRFGSRLTPGRQALYYAYLFLFGSIFLDAMLMNFILVFALMLLRREGNRWPWLAGTGGAFAAFSLMKFTSLFLCAFVLVIAAAYFCWTRRKTDALILLGSYALCFLAGWVIHGQSLLNLTAFFSNGLQVTAGYAGAMSEYETPQMFRLGLAAAIGVLGYAALYFAAEADRKRGLAVVLSLCAISFLNWKHGFTRADGHVLAHFLLVLMIVCSYPALTDDGGRFSAAKNSALALAAAASLGGMTLFMPTIVTMAAHSWNYRVRDTLDALAHPRAHRASLEQSWQNVFSTVDRPNLRGYMGGGKATHLGDDQAFSILNGFNFTPLPAVQSYSAYTPALNRLDAAFLRSPDGPHYVLHRHRGLSPRLPPLEDSLTQKLLYQTYYYLMEEGGLMLWERPAESDLVTPAPDRPLLDKTVQLGDYVAVPDTGDRPIWAEIHVTKTLLGRLRELVYKAPFLEFEVEYLDGKTERYRFVQAMGAAGFILSPLFRDTSDVVNFQTREFHRPLGRFRVLTVPGGGRYWSSSVKIELRTMDPFQRASTGLSVSTPGRFSRVSNRAPVRLEAQVPPTNIFVGGEHLLHMHAPSRMEFTVPDGFSTLRAQFGLMPNAYQGDNKTDGVEFVIEWLRPDGRTEELFRRYLNPLHVAADRGTQSVTLTPSQIKGGRLIFRTLPGPAGDTGYDWSYWAHLEIK